MKKRNILAILIIAVGIIGWCNAVSAGEMIDLGTIDYRGYLQKEIESPEEVDLTYIFSTVGDESYLVLDKWWYKPDINTTKYDFTSDPIDVEWWMTPGVESFYYQDENSLNGTIYIIDVDYSSIEIPPNPWELNLTNLTIDFENLSVMYFNLTEEYNNTNHSYNNAKKELKQKINELYNKSVDLSSLEADYDSISEEITILQSNLTNMTKKYNDTYNSLLESGANLSLFRMFYDNMHSYKTGFWFDSPEGANMHYTPVMESNRIRTGLEDELSNSRMTAPLWAILAIIVTALIMFFVFRVTSSKKIPTPFQIERDTEYKPESGRLDNFVNKAKSTVGKITGKNKVEETHKVEPEKTELNQMKTDISELRDSVDKLLARGSKQPE